MQNFREPVSFRELYGKSLFCYLGIISEKETMLDILRNFCCQLLYKEKDEVKEVFNHKDLLVVAIDGKEEFKLAIYAEPFGIWRLIVVFEMEDSQYIWCEVRGKAQIVVKKLIIAMAAEF